MVALENLARGASLQPPDKDAPSNAAIKRIWLEQDGYSRVQRPRLTMIPMEVEVNPSRLSLRCGLWMYGGTSTKKSSG